MGTRMQDETKNRPKALVPVGGRPILWHMMKYYGHYGFADFVVALGYRGDAIREYFSDPTMMHSGSTAEVMRAKSGGVAVKPATWTVEMVDTGLDTQNGGRLKRLKGRLSGGTFIMAYCDSLTDAVPPKLVDFHKSHGRLATVMVVNPISRYGFAELEGDRVQRFAEKPLLTDRWISTGYFVLEPGVFDYIDGDDAEWSYDCLPRLAQDGELMAYRHKSFWQCMDTAKERETLERYWAEGSPPWKVWE